MTIQFIQDYATRAVPPEEFTLGQRVEDRDEASEAHFVNRGYAAYVVGEKLIDRFGKEVVAPKPTEPDDDDQGDDDLDYERDNLADVDITKANKTLLLVIAKHEEVELPKGDETTVKELRVAIVAKREAKARADSAAAAVGNANT